jgi:hypothetical protein
MLSLVMVFGLLSVTVSRLTATDDIQLAKFLADSDQLFIGQSFAEDWIWGICRVEMIKRHFSV